MATWIALLRGVNVGGKNKLPMTEWAAGLESLGCKNARTYIQSGNAVFESTRKDAGRLAKDIADQVDASHGFRPATLVLSAARLAALIAANPFPAAAAEPKSLHLYFLEAAPKDADLAALDAARSKSEAWQISDGAFFLHAPDGIGRSKLAAGAERSLKVAATARNWNTVLKLQELCRG
ncbi:hypothetical protein Pla123a_22880 [Posidoniimonas polymericola]|uniref:DUF1697 domain-containing protein n=1 Tax=Posidoniimonas polymericola TaxID=2528002 RepID=A0A5C5YPL5_9BACT|nr:DUF1697 domain-containing protein [Posidoniimonas polymericola]TWT76864.1 hypothetical protein Pla123a_22880 [Posidoniimonas polymericola]